MDNHKKKMAAPIIITIIMVLYYLGVIAAFMMLDGIPGIVRFLFVAVPLALAGVMAGVLVSRIKEIRSGEEDDLSKY